MRQDSVIFFDGVCGLCNRFVDFVLARDREGRYRFAPLQGETATTLLTTHPTPSGNSVLLLEDGRILTQSTAALRIVMGLGGIWSWARFALWIPAGLRDGIYAVIASNRYRWFGKRETCRMPRPEEAARFMP
jgi:predicted DCC family thiol-disulfide oxidoreductase YuxK